MTETSDESKLINEDPTPKVIISASGMCEAGRIRHHLKHNLWKSENIILFVGYQAEGSLGRRLLNGEKTVALFGEDITVNAEIAMLEGTSGHADRNGLVSWLKGFKEKPQLVFVNHGDDLACEDFKNLLVGMDYNAAAPYSGTEYCLKTGKITLYTEGKPIDRTAYHKQNTRAAEIHRSLVAEAEKLLKLVKARQGRPNKDNARLASQIRAIIEKWKD